MRKAKGLCFNCDEKFSPSHKCANKTLLLLQWDDDSVDNSYQEGTKILVELDTSPHSEDQSLKHSLNAMNSTAVSGTMRFMGIVNGHPVKILLDGGSDDSFIQPKIAHFLNWKYNQLLFLRFWWGMGRHWRLQDVLMNCQSRYKVTH